MNMNEYTVYLAKRNELTEMKHSEDVGPASLTLDRSALSNNVYV